MTITVHHLENSRSQRVLWLLEELALPYAIKRYARDKATMLAPPELRNVHPLGKAPVIEDDGLVVAEPSKLVAAEPLFVHSRAPAGLLHSSNA